MLSSSKSLSLSALIGLSDLTIRLYYKVLTTFLLFANVSELELAVRWDNI
jgi:hypothetical protein